MHIYYIHMVYHVNHNKYLVFLCKFAPLPAVAIVCIFIAFVDPSQRFATVIYSTTDIVHSCATMPSGKRIKSGEKEII